MSLDATRSRLLGLISNSSGVVTDAGKALIHAQYPDEFEYYLIAFELLDENSKVTDRLIFPVMPDTVDLGDPHIISIKKTVGGIISTGNLGFSPKNISIQGGFGRKFRLLIDNKRDNLSNVNDFSLNVKTGYGVSKLFEAILNKSRTLTPSGKPYRLIMYNLAFNANYYVEVIEKRFSQSFSENMLWKYNVTLKAVAPVGMSDEEIRSKLRKLASIDVINKGANKLAQDLLATLTIFRKEAF